MEIMFCQLLFQFFFDILFVGLFKFIVYEQQLCVWVGKYIVVQQLQVGKVLLFIVWYVVYDGAFIVYDFIMGKWQYEVFVKGIDQVESNFFVVVLLVYRIVFEIVEGVVYLVYYLFLFKF